MLSLVQLLETMSTPSHKEPPKGRLIGEQLLLEKCVLWYWLNLNPGHKNVQEMLKY